jgi:hypothetical protein
MTYTFTVPELADDADIQVALNDFGTSVEAFVAQEFGAATTEYNGKTTISNVAGTVTSVGKIYVQSTQPSGAAVGDIWMW